MRCYRLQMMAMLVAGAGFLGGCGFGGTGADCSPGTKVACQCADQSSGEKICRDDQTYGPCDCGAHLDGGPGDGGPNDGGPSDGGPGDGGPVTCSGGLTACGNTCVDLTSDAAHCGSCARSCPTSAICSQSACVCPSGEPVCNGACTNTVSDPLNCGGCGHTCAVTQACVSGTCATPQDCRQAGCTGFAWCDTSTGICQPGCDHDGQCTGGKTCDTSTHSCVCATGLQDCNGACTDTQTDPGNCGTCGKSCSTSETCIGGTCQNHPDCTVSGCTGLTWCDPTTKACEPGCAQDSQCTGGQVCDTNTHTCGCPTGQTDCSGTCVDLTTDGNNCGTCGKTCSASQRCIASKCQDTANVCAGYDGTGLFGACVNGACTSSSLQCTTVNLLNSSSACVDTTPCSASPTAKCCVSGEFCGGGSALAPLLTGSFCCKPGEVVDSSGDTCVDVGKVIGCQTDSDCPAAWNEPYCNTNVSPPHCVVCRSDTDCTGGQRCDTASGSCVACLSTSDCATGKVCDASTHTCVGCLKSADCTDPSLPACDTSTQTCVACNADTDCTDPALPACNTSTHTCVACTQDSNCTDSTKPKCDTNTNTCVACVADSDCPSATPVCTGHVCAVCPSGTTCQATPDGRKACQGGVGIPCTSDSTCLLFSPLYICVGATSTASGLCLYSCQ